MEFWIKWCHFLLIHICMMNLSLVVSTHAEYAIFASLQVYFSTFFLLKHHIYSSLGTKHVPKWNICKIKPHLSFPSSEKGLEKYWKVKHFQPTKSRMWLSICLVGKLLANLPNLQLTTHSTYTLSASLMLSCSLACFKIVCQRQQMVRNILNKTWWISCTLFLYFTMFPWILLKKAKRWNTY